MRQVTLYGLALQFDAGQTTTGSDGEQAAQALDQINGLLQREPYGLGAQLVLLERNPIKTEGEERD